MFDQGFVHLNVRSYFSLQGRRVLPRGPGLRAARAGMPAVAVTDRDGLYGVGPVRRAAGAAGGPVRPIFGATLTVRTPVRDDRSVVLLAKDASGYGNLCRLVTDAHMTRGAGRPGAHHRRRCATARGPGRACSARSPSPGALAAAGRPMPPAERSSRGERRSARRPVRRRSATAWSPDGATDPPAPPAGPTTPACPPWPPTASGTWCREDAFLADVLECMREIVPLAAHHVTRRNAEGWLKPAAEMRALFAETAGPVRPDASRSPSGAGSTSGSADPLPRVPHAAGPERRLGAGRAVLAGDGRTRHAAHPRGPGPPRPRARP